MKFHVLPRDELPPSNGRNAIYLRIDHWNDYSFVTMFHVSAHDGDGNFYEIGDVKVAFKGQTTAMATYKSLPESFGSVADDFFSLGHGVEYYRNIASLPGDMGREILFSLRDIVAQPELIAGVTNEEVFRTSLLRSASLSVVKGQYARVLEGKAELTDYQFRFARPETADLSAIDVDFNVEVSSTPSTNIHALIGRNGVGKTTVLNSMIEAVVAKVDSVGKFFDSSAWQESEISRDYFSSLVSVSFSAFDAFSPPKEQPDPAKGACYFYVGLKDVRSHGGHRTINDLQKDCVRSLISCFADKKKARRWHDAIEKLGSDEIFASMGLGYLEEAYRDVRAKLFENFQHDTKQFRARYEEEVSPYLTRMSSGHAVVLLTITRLVATVEEKTLVLLDEPESHLHPPLLSAFVRALSDLLHDRNGVAIIATHSPVVLQEIPRSCVWKIYRSGKSVATERPSIETFAENVGLLTSEVFSLEVARSGFHDLLARSVASGAQYEKIVSSYDGQLGFEGRAILKVLIAERDRGGKHDEA